MLYGVHAFPDKSLWHRCTMCECTLDVCLPIWHYRTGESAPCEVRVHRPVSEGNCRTLVSVTISGCNLLSYDLIFCLRTCIQNSGCNRFYYRTRVCTHFYHCLTLYHCLYRLLNRSFLLPKLYYIHSRIDPGVTTLIGRSICWLFACAYWIHCHKLHFVDVIILLRNTLHFCTFLTLLYHFRTFIKFTILKWQRFSGPSNPWRTPDFSLSDLPVVRRPPEERWRTPQVCRWSAPTDPTRQPSVTYSGLTNWLCWGYYL